MMKTIKLKISVKKYRRKLFILLQCLLGFIIITMCFLHYFIISLIFFIFFIFFSIAVWIKEKRQKNEFIIFEEVCVMFDNQFHSKINYVDIQKIILHFIAIKGDDLFLLRTFMGVPKTGHENRIKIITKSQTIVKNVWCENEFDYYQFKQLGEFLKEKKLNVHMKGFNR